MTNNKQNKGLIMKGAGTSPEKASLQNRSFFHGWKTPNTYSKDYEHPSINPGIYCIVAFTSQTENQVVYIGSAKNLKQRYERHELLRFCREIYDHCIFYWREEINYKEVEKQLIQEQQPKFNKQWR